MAWTTPRAWRVSDKPTGALLNTYVRDNQLATEAALAAAAGDLFYGTAAATLAKLAKGADGTFLRPNDTPNAPAWALRDAWRVDVDVLSHGVANTNWSDNNSTNTCVGGGFLGTVNGNQNNYVEFPVCLSAGTWTCRLVYVKQSDAGIYSVRLDGTEVGTVDAYAASSTKNSVSDITGISVATTGKKTLRLQMATKNASASAYWAYLQRVIWFRTA